MRRFDSDPRLQCSGSVTQHRHAGCSRQLKSNFTPPGLHKGQFFTRLRTFTSSWATVESRLSPTSKIALTPVGNELVVLRLKQPFAANGIGFSRTQCRFWHGIASVALVQVPLRVAATRQEP